MSAVANPPRVALLDRIVSTQMGSALDEVNLILNFYEPRNGQN